MSGYPKYIHDMLKQARAEGQYYCYQPDCAALWFDVLALIPDCREASDLVYELFCDEWLICDNRNAVQQNIDEWDDRPHQQRRRFALSFRDPNAPSDAEVIRFMREKTRAKRGAPKWKPVIAPELAALFGEALPREQTAPLTRTLVDWSFLDRDDGQLGELPQWAKKQIRLMPEHADYIAQMRRWSRPIKPPSTPPRRNPNDKPFDPSGIFAAMDAASAELDADEFDADEWGEVEDDEEGGEIPF